MNLMNPTTTKKNETEQEKKLNITEMPNFAFPNSSKNLPLQKIDKEAIVVNDENENNEEVKFILIIYYFDLY